MKIRLPPDGVYHFEEMQPGASITAGAQQVTATDIIAFATAYDPQPIHLDAEAAKASIVGGLCASGFHTCALMMRLLCDNFLLQSASLGSPGLDEVKWRKPVRPGDTLSIRISVLESRPLQSRADVGISKMLFEMLDQQGEAVLEARTNQLMRRRHPGPEITADRTPKTAQMPVPSLFDEAIATLDPTRGNTFEDIVVGETRALGGHTFESDDIIGFARQFDPQPFHLSDAGGKNSLFGGLAASGWHTASIFIRQVVRERHLHEAAMRAAGTTLAQWGPSPGFRNLGWPKPVLAGDHVEFRNKTVEKRVLKSRPTHGLVVSQAEGRNQRGETVYRFTGQIIVERRRTE